MSTAHVKASPVVTSLALVFLVGLWGSLAFTVALVAPKFVAIFQDFGVPLPAYSRFMIGMTLWLNAHQYLGLALVNAVLVVQAVTLFQLGWGQDDRGQSRRLTWLMIAVPAVALVGLWLSFLQPFLTITTHLSG